MDTHSSCHTYFTITGSFDPLEVAKMLQLEPHQYWYPEDLRPDGKSFGFAMLSLCYCDLYFPLTHIQMEKTIEPLEDKIDLLLKLAEENNVEYVLHVVPTIAYITDGQFQEVTPCLSPSLRVMDFCTKLRADLDIDYYIHGSDD